MKKKCENCGKSFKPKSSKANYCGNPCKQMAYRKRVKSKELEKPQAKEEPKKETWDLPFSNLKKTSSAKGFMGIDFGKNRK